MAPSKGKCGRPPLAALLVVALACAGSWGMPAVGQTVAAVGNNYYSQCNVADWGGIKAIAAGGGHSVGLRSDGRVVTAGNGSYGQGDVSGWRGITAVAAGWRHTVGIRGDGTVVAVGDDAEGQCQVSRWSGIAAVAAGSTMTVGVKSNGTVVCTASSKVPDVSGWTDIAAIAVGDYHVLGLKKDGTVIAAGPNSNGQCGVSAWSGIAAVAAGGYHSVALTKSGTVVAVGDNSSGQCDVSGWKGVVAVAAGGSHTVGLKADGTVCAVGDNYYGQCDVSGWRGITAIAARWSYTLGVKAAARNPYLVFSAQPSGTSVLRPISPPVTVSIKDRFGSTMAGATNAVSLAIGSDPSGGRLAGTTTTNAVNGVATFANLNLDRPGSGYTLLATAPGFGSAASRSFDVSPAPARLAFTRQPIDSAPGQRMYPWPQVSVLDATGKLVPSATNEVTLAIAAGPRGVSLGSIASSPARDGIAGFANLALTTPGTYQFRAESPGLGAATSATFVVNTCQTVVAVGSDEYGQCAVSGWSRIVAVAAGGGHTVGLHSDGTVIAIGDNRSGQCNVSDWSDVIAIAAGRSHTVGLRSDGTVVAVGSNVDYDGNHTGACDVEGWTNIVAIAAGEVHTVGLRRNGSLVAAGNDHDFYANFAGQCDVSDWTGIEAIAAGSVHTLGLSSDGRVSVAGRAFSDPDDLRDWQGITAVAAGSHFAVGLPGDGTVLAGGHNSDGQCDVAGWTGIAAVAAGYAHTLGLKADGTVVGTGWNGNGQVGVALWRGITAIAAGTCHSVALKAPPARLSFTSQPAGGVSLQLLPTVTVTLYDRFGNPAATAYSTATLSLGANPSGGTLSGTRTVTAVNGVATFTDLKIDKPGSGYTLVATSPGLMGATSASFKIAASPARLAFTVQPTDATAGASLSPAVKVAVLDAFGNPVATASEPIQLLIAAGPAGSILSGVSTAMSVRGVATFSNLKLDKAGTYYLRAVSLTGLTGATSRAFTVTAGPPAKLAFTVQPGSTAAGAPISPAVRVAVQDRMGNALPAATHLVTLALSTNPTAALLAGTKSVAVTSGVAAFPGLSIAKAGSGYVLRATAPGLTTAYSAPFDVTPGAAARLVFLTQPAGAKVGAALAPAAKVGIQDSRGNLVTTASNAVTVRLGRNRTGAVLTGTAAVAEAGIATFADLKVDRAGAGYTLAASAPGLAGASSAPFSVTQ